MTYQCPPWQASWITSATQSELSCIRPALAPPRRTTSPPTSTTPTPSSCSRAPPTSPPPSNAFNPNGYPYCTSRSHQRRCLPDAHSGATYPYDCPATPPTTAPTTATGYATTIYDPAGQTSSSTDADGDTTAYTYDPVGNVLTTTDPRGKVTTNCYYDEDGTGQCAHSAPAGGGTR